MLFLILDGFRDRSRRSPPYYDESEQEDSFRIFVALFDYDPLSMSPNPDAADEELPFKEGQIIKVQLSWGYIICFTFQPYCSSISILFVCFRYTGIRIMMAFIVGRSGAGLDSFPVTWCQRSVRRMMRPWISSWNKDFSLLTHPWTE